MRFENPIKRRYKSGKQVYVARYTGKDGKRRHAGSFEILPGRAKEARRKAKEAIERAYKQELLPDVVTIGDYAKTWLEKHPRLDESTGKFYRDKLRTVLSVEIEGKPLGEWKYQEWRYRQSTALVDLLFDRGHAVNGVKGFVRTLSAMTSDAKREDIVEFNSFKELGIRQDDPRAQKEPNKAKTWTSEQLSRFVASSQYPALVACPWKTGMRIGEVLALKRSDWDRERNLISVERRVYDGRTRERTKGGYKYARQTICPPSLSKMFRELPPHVSGLMFPSPTGEMWHYRTFLRKVWVPTQEASGLGIKPHEMRHAFVSQLRANGVDPADVAYWAGHTVQTATQHYTHSLGESVDLAMAVMQ